MPRDTHRCCSHGAHHHTDEADRGHHDSSHQHHAHHAQPTAGPVALDPVCGMTVEVDAETPTSVHEGHTHYFCSARCRETFRRGPAPYTSAAPATPTPPADPAQEYTCPMHPEIVQLGPGSCPKCGMALEPRVISLATTDAPDPELVDLSRRLLISLALTVPVFAIAMS